MIKGVIDLFPNVEEKGVAKITNYEFKVEEDPLFNLRALRDGGSMFVMKEGKYVRLHVNGELMMSDTHMERISNRGFIYHAHGKVLIAGLGIGLVLKNILDKEEVKEVIVIEKYQDVIDLVAPKFDNPKLKIICADIHEWKPAKGEKFNVIYFDIWPEICEDNLDEIKVLHNKFKNSVDRTDANCWMNSWMKEYLQAQRKRNNRYW